MNEERTPEQVAFEAGRDCAINGPNTRNCHSLHFATPEMTIAWERGCGGSLTSDAFAALDYLAARAKILWPYKNFRQALNGWKPDEWQADATGRSQNVNAAFNGIARPWRKDDGAR